MYLGYNIVVVSQLMAQLIHRHINFAINFINSTFTFLRISDPNEIPLVSKLLINPGVIAD